MWYFSVQFSSVAQLCLTLCDTRDCSTPGLPVHHHSRSLLKLMSIESVMPYNHHILCHLFLLSPSVFPSIRVFSNESSLYISWPKYWSFSFNISPSNEYSGLNSFRMDWLDLLAVQGTLKSLLQHHRSKASILQHSAFSIVQQSYPYITTGKTIALARWTFVGKVMLKFSKPSFNNTWTVISPTVHWKDRCWSWNSNTLATWCEVLTHLKRPWCWERLKEREGDSRGWDGWMASLTQWTWVWVNSRSWW